ncbi:MAG: sigma-54-dependent Fis family transcriptional regulator, partial [Desulfarculus sp.]|nr:sigma-54-dependent Fis family transcriptional regulator [Desulfarculus sp.]
DLGEMAQAGRFRSDLLFRLRGLALNLPPLRARGDDLRALVNFHLERLCARYGLASKGLSPEFMEALAAHAWPGNVRELVQALEHALARAGTAPTLFARHLPDSLRVQVARAALGRAPAQRLPGSGALPPANASAADDGLPSLREHRRIQDRIYLANLMASHAGDVAGACRASGLSRSRLYELLKEHGLPRPGQRETDSSDIQD